MNDARAEFGVGAGARKEQSDQLVGMRASYLALEVCVKLLARGRAAITMADVESSHVPHSTTIRIMFALAEPAAKSYPFTRTRFAGQRQEQIP